MTDTLATPKPANGQDLKALPATIKKTINKMTARYRAEILCCFVLLLMAGNMLSLASRKSITNDELVHIPAGYQHLVAGNFNLNPEHPPLVKMWACLPLLLVKPEATPVAEPAAQGFAEYSVLSAIDFWQANRDRFLTITFWCRVPMVLLTLFLGVVIFIYARRLFGARAAVLSVVLFSLEPTMLAHGWIVHTDIAAALGYLLFVFALHNYQQSPTMPRALYLGLATAFALLTKFSLAIVIPIFIGALVYAVVRAPRWRVPRPKLIAQGCLSLLAPLCLMQAVYFRHSRLGAWAADWIAGNVPSPLAAERTIAAINLLSKIVPSSYLFGMYTVYVHNHFGHPASLLGRYSTFGWWYYFPVAFALKTSLPFLLLTVVSLCWAVGVAIVGRERKLVLLLLAMAVYVAVSMASHINIGIRHLAPIFPFLFILGGACLDRLLKYGRARVAVALVVVLLSWMVIDAVRAYPNYLTFTSPLTFGKPGWALLSDSNVEWGQDIGELARYLRAHGETKLIGSLSGGWETPALYEIQLLDFAPPDLSSSNTRYVAIGAGFLNGSTVPSGLKDANGVEITEQQRRDYFSKYRTIVPEKVFGGSIYLYRARE